MPPEHISHKHLKQFAENTVNLTRDGAKEYREQANRLREKIKQYLSESDVFDLEKMLLSGSLAKGTALSTLNDIDIAIYISGVDTSYDAKKLYKYLKERLEKAFPNFSASQITVETYAIRVDFKGSGLNVDVVPIIYDDDPNWKGHLISQNDGSRLMTSIPMHLEFFKTRKQRSHPNFAEIVRLVKWWVAERQNEHGKDVFRFKSFMVELILCHLWDDKSFTGDDYIEALRCFFNFLANDGLNETIIFEDNYRRSDVHPDGIIRIYDPVNPKNNVASRYTQENRNLIEESARDARDAIIAAKYATDESETVRHWRRVFGPELGV